ncbi:hypothetical protein KK120_18065 [Virgibacillus dakarensis]|uniref:hypothetical protein n=1 Tax=Virgibacillus dakarensis TaxID=1917889 RepID=UPI000B437A0E|nr:hypothetical protein [Virgibacillus dakarensis]MBT2217720.1 hypothetical protein [Virgibacillus dakarensis]
MGRQLKGLLYFYATDARYSLLIFWSILLSTLLVSIVGAYFLLNVENGQMTFALSMAIYIYCGITGFIQAKHGIPFSIKMGSTRKNIFAGMGLFFLGLALAKSVLANTIHSVILFGTDKMGISSYQLIHPAQLLTDTWLTRVIIDATVMFFLLSFMFLLGLLFYKYGLLGGGVVVGTLAIILLFGLAQGWIADFFIDIFQSFDMTFFYEVFAVGIVLYVVTWIMLRRITTEAAR